MQQSRNKKTRYMKILLDAKKLKMKTIYKMGHKWKDCLLKEDKEEEIN